MKIVYLHQYFNTPSMWGSHRSYEMARRLVSMGHQVQIITAYLKDDKKKSFDTEIDGIKIHWIPVPYSNYMSFDKRIWAFIKFSIFAIPAVLKNKSDLIFATSTPLTVCIPAIILKIFTRKRFIFEVRDLWPELPIAFGAIKNPILIFLAKLLEKAAYYFADAIIALSPGMKEGIVKKGKNSQSIAVIPNSCDFNLSRKNVPKLGSFVNNINDHDPVIAFMGAFGLINNLEWIVELGESLENIDSNVKILLIGDGIMKDHLLNSINSRNLLERIKVIDPVPKKDIPNILNNIKMSIITFNDIPAMRNNSANKFFDSLATATPVIINFGGWINKLVNDNECGIDGWKKSLPEVAKNVHDKCNNNEWLNIAGRNAHDLGKKYFDRDIAAKNLNNIFNSVLNGDNNISHFSPESYNLK